MKILSPQASNQMDYCSELKELMSIFDVVEKTLHTHSIPELKSVTDVLITTNEWFRRFYKVESEYSVGLAGSPDDTPVRNDEENFERLTELYSIHSHYDVCCTVVSDLRTDDLVSLSEVFMAASSRLYCLYREQAGLDSLQEVA